MTFLKFKPFLFCFFFLLSFHSISQKKNLFPKLNLIKTGPYIGIQKGEYTVIEIGAERQWKRLKFKKSKSNAINAGFNYNLIENVLGYDFGFWHKEGLLGLTLGGTICLRTDFNDTRFGFSPTLGYKLWLLHLQSGYHFLTKSNTLYNTNSFFVSIRVVFVNDRKFKNKKSRN